MTVLEFRKRFATEEACIEYLEQIRWPDEFRCPGFGAADRIRRNTTYSVYKSEADTPVNKFDGLVKSRKIDFLPQHIG